MDEQQPCICHTPEIPGYYQMYGENTRRNIVNA